MKSDLESIPKIEPFGLNVSLWQVVISEIVSQKIKEENDG